MLHVESICKTYTQRPPHVQVLRDISFDVEESRFVTLLGSSGCGKTTLLTLVGGFHKPSSGKMVIQGREIKKPGPDRGFVFQNYALFPWLTVKQNVQFPMKERGLAKHERDALCARLLAMAQLRGAENLYPGQLSGGMKQRVAFIRVLAGNPDILLLDEPLGAIDPQMRKALQVELETLWLQDRKTVLMVTHDIDEAVYLSDRILVMAPCASDITRQKGTNLIAEINMALSRPRDRNDAAYKAVFRQVEQCLEHVAATENKSGAQKPFSPGMEQV
jgi:NitT/TauT family transport system ATP-binding protein